MELCWEPSAFCVLKVKKGFKKTFIKNFKGKVIEVEEILRFPKNKSPSFGRGLSNPAEGRRKAFRWGLRNVWPESPSGGYRLSKVRDRARVTNQLYHDEGQALTGRGPTKRLCSGPLSPTSSEKVIFFSACFFRRQICRLIKLRSSPFHFP